MRRDFLKRFADPRRDIDDECGFPKLIRPQDYQDMYDREAIAARAVEFMARECWKSTPEVYEDHDQDAETPWEAEWRELLSRIDGERNYFEDSCGSVLYAALEDLDVISGIGQYGVALIGFSDGLPLAEPVAGVEEAYSLDQKAEYDKEGKMKLGKRPETKPDETYNLTVNAQKESISVDYIRVFSQVNARIVAFEANKFSPRYGQPTKYQLTFDDSTNTNESMGTVEYGETVHWTRILHVPSDGGVSSSKVFGISRLQQIFNDLLGERKVSGGSPEGYWKMCFTSLVFETLPGLGASPKIDKQALKETIQDFQNGLQKFMLATGVTAKSIAPSVVDPTPHHNMIVERICIKGGYPVRLFKGSERGEMSSAQDSEEWNSRVSGRRDRRCTPRILAPLVNRFIMVGVLSEPEQLYTEWPETVNQTPMEKATLATTRMGAVASFVDKGSQAMTPLDFWTREMGYSVEDAEALIDALEKMQEETDKAQALLDEQTPPDGEEVDAEDDTEDEDLPVAEEIDEEETDNCLIVNEICVNCGGPGGTKGPCPGAKKGGAGKGKKAKEPIEGMREGGGKEARAAAAKVERQARANKLHPKIKEAEDELIHYGGKPGNWDAGLRNPNLGARARSVIKAALADKKKYESEQDDILAGKSDPKPAAVSPPAPPPPPRKRVQLRYGAGGLHKVGNEEEVEEGTC